MEEIWTLDEELTEQEAEACLENEVWQTETRDREIWEEVTRQNKTQYQETRHEKTRQNVTRQDDTRQKKKQQESGWLSETWPENEVCLENEKFWYEEYQESGCH